MNFFLFVLLMLWGPYGSIYLEKLGEKLGHFMELEGGHAETCYDRSVGTVRKFFRR